MKDKIYAYIKAHNGATVEEIADALNLKRYATAKILDTEVLRGFVKVENGRYSVVHFLMPPVQKPAQGIAWDYGKIQKAGPAFDSSAPPNVMSPWNKKVAPRQQGDRGICVGEGSSELMDYFHLQITKQDPTGTIVRDIVDPVASLAIRDQLYDQTFSAQFIYDASRKEGNVTEPSGSYCNAAIRALYKVGICLEKQWWTSKSARGVWQTPYPASQAECEVEAAKHKIDGYAVIRTINDLRLAIFKNGVALGAINIYENYTQNTVVVGGVVLFDGNLLDPRGECVGSHALCFIGYDDNEQRLYFRHSWQGWTELGSISYNYWNQAGGDFWAALDANEAVIGAALYRTFNISILPQEASSVAVVLIDKVMQDGKPPYKVTLEKGKMVFIEAVALGYTSQSRIVMIDDSTGDISFVLEIVESGDTPLWRRVINWFSQLFLKIFRR
jgi:hypothetical protein